MEIMSMKISPKNKRVILGLSGGVDSAVAAVLLKKEGYEVIGRYVKGYAPPGVSCPEERDLADARAIALQLGIDFRVINESSEAYRDNVYRPFIGQYFAGKTPNPDIHCNKLVKFPFLARAGEEYGAEFIATGHYFRRADDRFFMAEDANKDQSYFLYAVPRQMLLNCLFPIGGLTKAAVRLIAEKLNLSVAKKRSTRGVCMVGDLSLPEAIEYEAENMGKVLTPANAVLLKDGKEEELGQISGSVFLASTIGQRNGFGISYRFPVYVVRKDVATNTLFFEVMPEGEKNFLVSNLNFVSPEVPEFPLKCFVKIRTPGKLQNCLIRKNGEDRLTITLDHPDSGIAPGQSAVFYRDAGDGLKELLGGGIIN